MCSRFYIGGRKVTSDHPGRSLHLLRNCQVLLDTVGQPLLVRRSSLSPVGELGRQLRHKAAKITKISLCYHFISASLLANSTIRPWKKLKKDS